MPALWSLEVLDSCLGRPGSCSPTPAIKQRVRWPENAVRPFKRRESTTRNNEQTRTRPISGHTDDDADGHLQQKTSIGRHIVPDTMEHRQGNTSCAKESQTRKRDETKLPQLLSRGESTQEKNGVTAQLLVRLIINSIRADARPTHTQQSPNTTRPQHSL